MVSEWDGEVSTLSLSLSLSYLSSFLVSSFGVTKHHRSFSCYCNVSDHLLSQARCTLTHEDLEVFAFAILLGEICLELLPQIDISTILRIKNILKLFFLGSHIDETSLISVSPSSDSKVDQQILARSFQSSVYIHGVARTGCGSTDRKSHLRSGIRWWIRGVRPQY